MTVLFPMEERTYFVYIMSSLSRVIYTGVTNNLERWAAQHKDGQPGSISARYNVKRLVYFERFGDICYAISREKAIKHMYRAEKIRLIESMNPEWNDLSEE